LPSNRPFPASPIFFSPLHFSRNLFGVLPKTMLETVHLEEGSTMIISKKISLLSTAIVALLVACHSSTGMNLSPNGPGLADPNIAGGLAVPPAGEVIACTANADCAVLDLGCSGNYCSTNWIVSVNVNHASDVATRDRATCEQATTAPSETCTEPFPKCVSGICTWTMEWDQCASDTDCAVIEVGCCDHCNGGRVMAAALEYAEMVKERFGETCAAETMCTLRGCAAATAHCVEARCRIAPPVPVIVIPETPPAETPPETPTETPPETSPASE
jgi:hypothetical protein